MLEQRRLDFLGVDVDATADHHVLLAIDQEKIALLVEVAEVAGDKPAVADGGLGFRGLPPITRNHRRAAYQNFADLPGGQVVSLVIDDAHFRVHRFPAGRGQASRLLGRAVEHMVLADEKSGLDGFGQSVTLGVTAGQTFERLGQDRGRHRPAAVEQQSKAAKVGAGDIRVVHHRVDHGGHQERDRHALGGNGVHPGRGVELLENDLSATEHHVGHAHEHGAHVVDRRCDQIDVMASAAIGDELIESIGDQIAMRNHRALGQTGGAAGEENGEGIGILARGDEWMTMNPREHRFVVGASGRAGANGPASKQGRQQRPNLGGAAQVSGTGDQQRRLGVIENLGHLAGGEPVIHRHGDHAGTGGAEVQLDIFRTIGQQDGDAVAGMQPGGHQCGGDTVDSVVKLGPGQPPSTHRQRGLVGEAQRVAARNVVECHDAAALAPWLLVDIGHARFVDRPPLLVELPAESGLEYVPAPFARLDVHP